MNAYIGNIRTRMSEYIDAPLYQGFRNKAAETISTIHLEDIRTTNTLGVKAIEYADGYATAEEEIKKDLGFEDFLGTADYSGAEPGDQLKAFTAMFQSEYDKRKTTGELENSKIESVDDYLNEIMSMGEFDHKKDQPLLSFLSGLADITIILPLIEGCAGYDFITGEDLTGFESGMKIVFAVVDVATLGMAIGATGVLKAGVSLTAKEATLLLGKTVAIETASNIAGYSTGFMANEAKIPVPLVIALSILAGSSVGKFGTKLAIKNGAETVIIESKIITEIKYKPSSGAILKATPGKTTTILGSYENDMQSIVEELGNIKSTDFVGNAGGFNVLNVPDNIYKNLTRNEFWELYNKTWLKKVIQRGDDIMLATVPAGKVMQSFNNITGVWGPSGFAREYQYLIDNGYYYNSATNMMVK